MEAQMALRDAEIVPSDKVLKDTLGDVYDVLESFLATITNEAYLLSFEWRYYNDGKAWLCKVQHKKKTILWLSVWEGFFKVSFFFTEQHLEAFSALDISEAIKTELASAKAVGRLIPMIFNINNANQLEELLTVVRFKKTLK